MSNVLQKVSHVREHIQLKMAKKCSLDSTQTKIRNMDVRMKEKDKNAQCEPYDLQIWINVTV